MTDNKVAGKRVQVRQTKPYKLKDKAGRQGVRIDFRAVFGFVPDVIVIQKVYGQNNAIVVNAVLTPRELALEKQKIKKTQPIA